MILAAIILAAVVLELGLLCGAYRQGRTVAERDEARCRLITVRGGEAPPAPWTASGPCPPASSQFDSHPEARE